MCFVTEIVMQICFFALVLYISHTDYYIVISIKCLNLQEFGKFEKKNHTKKKCEFKVTIGIILIKGTKILEETK